MTSEFKKIKNNEDTHYVLETATAGATSSSVVATAPGKKREDSILAQEKKETPKPRNFVVKNAKMGGAGKMKDKSKTIPRKEKHKKPVAEGVSDLSYDAQSLITKLRRDVEEKRLKPTPEAVLAAARELASDMEFAPQLLVKQVLGQGIAEKIDSRFRKTEWIPIADALKILKHYGATIEEWGGHFHFAYYDREGVRKRIEDLTWNADDTRNVRLSILNQAVRELKAQQQGVAEGFNGEYDDEAGMAHTNLLTSARAVMGLLKTIEDKDNLPEWVQEKIAKAEMMLVGVWDYLQSQKEQGIDPQVEGLGRMRGSSSAYDRDYASSVSGMDRGNNHRDDERHDLDPSDWYIVKDGKMYKTSVYPRQEQEAIARGYSRTREEAKAKADNVAEGERTMSRAAKGNEKYGKDGMKALAKAGREGASDEKLDTIRDKHDNYNEDSDPCWDSHKMVGTKKKGGKTVPNCVPKESSVAEVAPPGWEKTVKAMKKHDNIDNPFALAWSMKNKGYKSHKKESADPYFESLRVKVEELAKK